MSTHWTKSIDVKDSGDPIYLSIARSIARDIHRRRFQPGDRLPGTRELAQQLGVNRNTVFAAYQELTAEGWIVSVPKRGTFVASDFPRQNVPRPVKLRTGGEPWGAGSDGFPVLAAPMRPRRDGAAPRGTLVMTSGSPDLATFPVDELARAFRRALRLNHRLLDYGSPAGHPRLREAIADMISATRGIPATSDNILVTSGSQMAYSLLASGLVRPGDVIGVEEIGYRQAWEAFEAAGARVEPLTIDRQGVRPESVSELAAQGQLRAIYITPHRQYPTTVGLAAGRRVALLDLAERMGFAIIEDDYDHEFSYAQHQIMPLASMDTSGVVAYVGTFSKVLAPGLRIGFVAAPKDQIERLARWRHCSSVCGDQIVEAAVADLLFDGEIQRHINRVRRAYKLRHDALVELVEDHLGHVAGVVPPNGGTSLWLDVVTEVNVEAWSAAGQRLGVVFRPGRRYSLLDHSLPNVRLSFNHADVGALAAGVQRMAAALDAM